MQKTDRAVSDLELAGIDALDMPITAHQGAARRAWRAAWPLVLAVLVLVVSWQLVVMSGWRPTWALPGPLPVAQRLVEDLANGEILAAALTTMGRIAMGFALALLIGTLIGLAIVRWQVLRAAMASLITGLQTMPSIAWFPLAILLFGLTEQAILFVVVLGAAPSVANGVIAGVDNVPRLLLRAGRMLGARGINAYRHVILPAAL